MNLIHKLYDKKVKAFNLLFEINLNDYLAIADKIFKKNQFQRRRVKSSSTVYSLLKQDLMVGCIIPPIVLALSKQDKKITEEEINKYAEKELANVIIENIESLIILDGLQRTYTIKDLFSELKSKGDQDTLEKVKKHLIRIEIYFGIDKLGILYRMLTLNTGQTPMSLRHQIEILYSDYLNTNIEGIKLLLEAEDTTPQKFGEYKFKDIIEGFNSYIDRDYLTIDRNDVLENIKTLEKLSKENQDRDLFKDYLLIYHNLVKILIEKSNKWEYNENDFKESPLSGQPFGKNAQKIFTKPQVMTGFGSAIGKLVDFNLINYLSDIYELIKNINISNPQETLNSLILKLDKIRTTAKKIGNDQRMFFHFLFRELFDKKGEAFLNLDKAIEEAFNTYLRKTQ
ncbi:MAG: hypothetical protein AB1444_07090 [Spirochaetota bacterium]